MNIKWGGEKKKKTLNKSFTWTWVVILKRNNNTYVKCYVRWEDLWAIRVLASGWVVRSIGMKSSDKVHSVSIE